MTRTPLSTINKTNIILSVVAVILLIGFGAVLFFDNIEDKANYAKNMEINSQFQVERRERAAELEKREGTDSFYQKLQDGFDVNILIVGDSISLGMGASDSELNWIDLMQSYIMENYCVNVKIKNLSLADSTSYAGYVRTMALSNDAEYDLAIVCYGQNDEERNFGVFYESVIRAVRTKFEKCSIISVLESSQKRYTNKIKTIQDLAEHYGIPVADTIKPFTDEGNGGYNKLTDDGINPNDNGQQIYADIIDSVIDDEVTKGTAYDNSEIEPINAWSQNLTNFKGITAQKFKRNNNRFIYTLNEPLTGVFGINYKYLSGENGCKIFIDGKEYKAPEVGIENSSLQRYILLIRSQRINIKSTIEVRFNTEEQANGFNGILVSWN